jgi:uncharacterized protein (UPF0261 family)
MTTVALLAALDTKATDAAFIRDRIRSHDHEVVLIDTGILGEPGLVADIPREQTAAAGGTSLDSLRERGDRSDAVATMTRGATKIIADLLAAERIAGVFALGGGAGTTIGCAAMRSLPLGLPKVVLSTVASGDTSEYVGTSDIVMFPSIVDVAGINRISRRTYARAADAFAAMVRGAPIDNVGSADDRPMIAATMFGVTTPVVTRSQRLLDAAGYEVLTFHATGVGGRTMERLVKEGFFRGVLDLTTTEIADELIGGILSAGPDRLDAAALNGVPQVVSLGAIDMVNFGPRSSVPAKFGNRLLYQHNEANTLMRTTADEVSQISAYIADKLNQATAATIVLVPQRGVSALDAEGQLFHDPDALCAAIATLTERVDPTRVTVELVDAHINDAAFADLAVERLLTIVAGGPPSNLKGVAPA